MRSRSSSCRRRLDNNGDKVFTEFRLPVLANDRVLPDFGQTLSVLGVGIDDTNALNAPDTEGSAEVPDDAGAILYMPRDEDGPFPYEERFTYEMSDGTTRRNDAQVVITVLERANVRDMETNDDAYTGGAGQPQQYPRSVGQR